jgi:trehalose/maltose hydrolase-like predicted phosphorylase
MTFEEVIDVNVIHSWIKGEHGAVKGIAKKLDMSASWVTTILRDPTKRNNEIIEEAMNVVIARQEKMIKLMTKINENNRTIKELIASTQEYKTKTLNHKSNDSTNEIRSQV